MGTSENFVPRSKMIKKRRAAPTVGSDTEDSYSSSCSRGHGRHKSSKIHSFTPSTPPPTSTSYRIAKRRKGIPHRAPMGGLIIEY